MKINLQSVVNDIRYSINLEFCGHPQKMYVVRFCGDFVSSHEKENDAILKCIFHQDERMYKLLTI